MIATVQTAKCLVDDEGCARNIASALSRGLPLVTKQKPRKGRLAIVAGGPSAADHLEELRDWDGHIWAINGAFCWLAGEGIIPHGYVALDPGKGCEQLLTSLPEQSTYYIAAICDPALFDRVQGRDVRVWCSIHNDLEYPKDAALITGGTTCLTRAPFLALIEGWRDITIFGGDCSFRDHMYAYDESRYDCPVSPKVVHVRVGGVSVDGTSVGGEVFATNEQMIRQVSFLGGLQELVESTGFFGADLKFRADGLLKAWLAAPIMKQSEPHIYGGTDYAETGEQAA